MDNQSKASNERLKTARVVMQLENGYRNLFNNENMSGLVK